MTLPDYQTLMLPVLKLAAEAETRAPDVEEHIASEMGLPAEERDQLLPSGKQRVLHNRIHWAKFYMSKAGLIESTRRGYFVATNAGRELLATNPTRIDNDLLNQYPGFREFRQGEGTPSLGELGPLAQHAGIRTSATPVEQIEAAYLELQTALQVELLDRILRNSPGFFEGVIVELLLAMGYGGSYRNAAQQLGRTGDGGVDGVISEDRLGLDRIYVQAKRYKPESSVGRPDVQAFVGSLVGFGATKGVFVTTSTFSPQATAFVQHLPQRIILIDGATLASLMIEHNVGVRVSRTIEFKRLDEDFFSDSD
jgi:restriction system protein